MRYEVAEIGPEECLDGREIETHKLADAMDAAYSEFPSHIPVGIFDNGRLVRVVYNGQVFSHQREVE